MTWFSLQMLSLGSLLILNDPASLLSAKKVSCLTEEKLKRFTESFQRKHWSNTSVSKLRTQPQDTRTCAQAAKEMFGGVNNRSVSPWRYHLNRDENRFPHEISFAECLCTGCIIEHREDLTYNSVLVFADFMVLKKTLCPFDSKQHVVKKNFIKVPVACICVLPKYYDQRN